MAERSDAADLLEPVSVFLQKSHLKTSRVISLWLVDEADQEAVIGQMPIAPHQPSDP